MTKEMLKEILMEKSVSFTYEELQQLIDDELEKSEDEMDTALIDRCLELMNQQTENQSDSNKKRRLKLSRVLLIAAIIIVILGIAIPVGAKFLHIETTDDVVKYCNDYFKVNMSDEKLNDTADLKAMLAEVGVDEIALPTALFNGEYSIYEFDAINIDEHCIEYSFNISKDNIDCYMIIDNYSNIELYQNTFAKFFVPDDCDAFKEIEIEGVKVLIYSNKEESSIYYYKNNNEYKISLGCDFETAVSFAETIDVI